MENETFSINVGGKEISATFTDLADQTNGSVIMRLGNTTVLITTVMGVRDRNDINYFPLSVEYEEKFYAAGQILGSRFIRREGRPSDDAILSGRVVDRTIRPLFDHQLRKDVQVVITVLSIDEDDPDVLGVNGASLALSCSNIPWAGPVSAVRIGKKRGSDEFVVNPNYEFRNAEDTELDLLICGKDGTITMIEVGAKEVSEEVLTRAFEAGMKEVEKIQAFQMEVAKKMGKEKAPLPEKESVEHIEKVFTEFGSEFESAVFSGVPGKGPVGELKSRFIEKVTEEHPEDGKRADDYFESKVETIMRDKAIESGARVDGRKADEVRPLFAQAGGVSDILHGSGIFFRGGTHILSVLTLGGPEDSQIIDSIEEPETKKRFIHHYNFPPYSVGETGKIGGMNRRMVGHGALAEKALEPVVPSMETFPYTIRLVSEALASNGSTSMGSVCGSTLAMMDGGVPITRPVAGIAMGIMYKSPDEYQILTDIQGPEDHHGDMDFKVAGTAEGVTAIQLDVKVDGVPPSIMGEALKAAKDARLHILDVMQKEIAEPRDSLSPRAPHIEVLTIPPDMIGMVIGPSGKNIKKIKEDAGTEEITIEDDGTVFICGKGDAAVKAKQAIEEMTRVFEAGEVIEGEVTRILDFGAFVRLNSKTEGLVHISEIAPFRIEKVTDALKEGEQVKVQVKEIDDQGRVNLSIKMIDPKFAERKGLKPSSNNENNKKDSPK